VEGKKKGEHHKWIGGFEKGTMAMNEK